MNYIILEDCSEYAIEEEEVLMNEGLSLQIKQITSEFVYHNAKPVQYY